MLLSLANANFNKQFLHFLSSSFGNDDLADVTLACEGQYMKVHKIILSASSLYLRRLIKDNPHAHPIIILHNVEFQSLLDVVQYMYHGDILIELNRVSKFVEASQLLEVQGLSDLTDSDIPLDQVILQKVTASSNARQPDDEETLTVSDDQIMEFPDQTTTIDTHCYSTSELSRKRKRKVKRRCKPRKKKLRLMPTLKPLFSAPGEKLADNHGRVDHNVDAQKVEDQTINSHVSEVHDLVYVKEEVTDDDEHISRTEITLLEDLVQDSTQMACKSSEFSREESLELTDDSSELEEMTECDAANDPDAMAQESNSPAPEEETVRRIFVPLRELVHLATSKPKLAFHERRPCPICHNMYRDAATLRTHNNIMHTIGKIPFECTCKEKFKTKYEMQIHKQNGHRIAS